MFQNPNTSFDARVAQGVALLSARNPTWFGGINLATLDVRHGRHCVLAQLADGLWKEGARKYCVRDASQQFNCGFYESPDASDTIERYQKLTVAWRKAIIALHAGSYVGAVSYESALPALAVLAA